MRFSGTSKTGNFEEALGYAITAAAEELGKGTTDVMVTWHLLLVSGIQGGIAGFNDLTVEIFATA